MNALCQRALALPLLVMPALGQTTHPNAAATPSETVVRNLYTQVIAHHPHGIPASTNAPIFSPYLSKNLLHQIADAKACSADWNRTNAYPQLKREMNNSFSPFSYGGWASDPTSFHIQKAEAGDGGVLVYLQFKGRDDLFGEQWSWRSAAVVIQEEGRFVVNDVVYLNDNSYDNPKDKPADSRLSEYLTTSCNGPHWIGYSLPTQPDGFVRGLYEKVVAKVPGGIPDGINWQIFAPYMSSRLQHRIDDFDACVADWDRKHHDPKNPEKAPFGIFESGMFSGGDEKTGPRAFQIGKTDYEKDGTIRVYVTLKWWEVEKATDKYQTSAEKPLIWHVATVLLRERGRLVVDDVIFLKEESWSKEYRLSDELSVNCKGRRFAGYRSN